MLKDAYTKYDLKNIIPFETSFCHHGISV